MLKKIFLLFLLFIPVVSAFSSKGIAGTPLWLNGLGGVLIVAIFLSVVVPRKDKESSDGDSSNEDEGLEKDSSTVNGIDAKVGFEPSKKEEKKGGKALKKEEKKKKQKEKKAFQKSTRTARLETAKVKKKAEKEKKEFEKKLKNEEKSRKNIDKESVKIEEEIAQVSVDKIKENELLHEMIEKEKEFESKIISGATKGEISTTIADLRSLSEEYKSINEKVAERIENIGKEEKDVQTKEEKSEEELKEALEIFYDILRNAKLSERIANKNTYSSQKEFEDRQKIIEKLGEKMKKKEKILLRNGKLFEFRLEAEFVEKYVHESEDEKLLLEELLILLRKLEKKEEYPSEAQKLTKYLFYPLRRVVPRKYQMNADWKNFLELHKKLLDNKEKKQEERKEIKSILQEWNESIPDLWLTNKKTGEQYRIETESKIEAA